MLRIIIRRHEPYNCIAAGPTATDVALWQAMNEAEKYGLRTDDKLIRKALNDAGYYLVRSMKKPDTCELETLDVNCPELEAVLRGGGQGPDEYDYRQVAGVEVLPEPKP